jgi:cytochrome c oxidase subunit II
MAFNTAFDCVAGASTALLLYVGVSAAPPSPPQQLQDTRVIEVIARRFEFSPSRIEVTEGETVRLVVRSADGLHGIGIKKFKVAEEVPRGGAPVTIEFTATATGEFDIVCSTICGEGHDAMKGKLVVRPRGGEQP